MARALTDDLIGSGMPPHQARALQAALDTYFQAKDAELSDLAATLSATAAQINTAAAFIAALTATAAEVNLIDNAVASATAVPTAGATDVCIFTVTLKDAAGVAMASRRAVLVYITEDANGDGVSADTYSTGAAVSDGVLIAALTANKVFLVLAGADGLAAISITDSAKPADQRLVVIDPVTGRVLAVSAASAALWGA